MNTPDTYQALFIGYTAIWLMIAFYLLLLRAKINKISGTSCCKSGDCHVES